MDITPSQQPSVDYFNLPARRLQDNDSLTTYNSDQSPYAFSEPSPDSCDSIFSSPKESSLNYPAYTLPKTERVSKTDQIFNFGTFDDWMGWDAFDPSDNALSPTSEFFPELKMEPLSPAISKLDIQRGTSFASGDQLFQSPSSHITPSVENLYSNTPSWNQSSVGISPQRFSRLSAAEESHLRSIAMPQLITKATPSTAQQYPASPSSTTSPDPSPIGLKRKSTMDEDDMNSDSDEEMEAPDRRGRGKPVKKTAHNMIEKRYRTNLNDKISALRDSVPSLRVVTKNKSKGARKGEEEDEEDLQGLTPAHKLNKATVLAKATEYIAHLEKRNRNLTKENAALKSRVEAFEILLSSRQAPPQRNISGDPRGSASRQQSGAMFDSMLN